MVAKVTIRGHSRENENVSGISLQYRGVRRPTYEDGLSGETWKRVADPCENEFISTSGQLEL
jgi:hypothetical protein